MMSFIFRRAVAACAGAAVAFSSMVSAPALHAAAPGAAPSLRKVVIDAGHGGKDPGAVSKDKKTYEKTITLDISNRLAALISEACPDVSVIRTRPEDTFVELSRRADIANKENADLFISIHVNSERGSSTSGFSVHTMGQSADKGTDLYEYNMEICRRENSVILLENDYSTKYEGFNPKDPGSYIFMQLMQSAYLEQSLEFARIVTTRMKESPVSRNKGVWQNPFYVLWRTSMPSVLVEIGYLSNDSDLSVLRSEENRAKIARCLFEAFLDYKSSYDKSVGAHNSAPSPSPSPSPATAAAPDLRKFPANSPRPVPPTPVDSQTNSLILYGIQISAGPTRLPSSDKCFKGLNPMVIDGGNVFRYVAYVNPSLSEVQRHLSEVRSLFKGAFVVEIDGSSTRMLK